MAVQEKQALLQEEQATLTQRIREREQKIMTLENWKREAERYQLTARAPGVFTYRLKPDMEDGEPPHHLCAKCYEDGKKSILQPGPRSRCLYQCDRCGSLLMEGETRTHQTKG